MKYIYCPVCGERVFKYNKFVCSNCKSNELEKCFYCNKEERRKDLIITTNTNNAKHYYHKNCYDKMHKKFMRSLKYRINNN